MENERIRILSEKEQERSLAEVRTRSRSTNFQPSRIEEVSQRKEIDHTITSEEQSRRDQLLLQEQLSEQNRDLREAHIKSLHEMEE